MKNTLESADSSEKVNPENQTPTSIESQKSKSDKAFMSGVHNIQTYVYLAYAYILIMGIASDSIFYKFMGINIISYSNVLDVILSPLVHLIDSLALLVAIVAMPLVAFLYIKLLRFLVSKSKKKSKLASHDLIVGNLKNQVFVMTGIMIFAGLIGSGFGQGSQMSDRMKRKDLKPNHEIIFRNGESKKVHLIGSNSGFVFYVDKDESVVSISPIQENIVVMKKISEKN